MARPAWDKLSPENQKLIEQVSAEAALRDRDLTMAAAKTATETLKAAGVQFHPFPESDKKKWKAQNPDFFSEFVVAQDKAGRGDAAKHMVKIWKEVVE
jgi:TRAP-type C4-dicarboxylate transport system substrate-binding protein